MTQATEQIVDQSVLDGLMADAQGVADAIAAYLGAPNATACVTIGIHDVPANAYHALPHRIVKAINPRDDGTIYSWKSIARAKLISRIDVACADDRACPDQHVSGEAA